MTIEGKITHIMPEESGETRNGKTWRKRMIVIETAGQYPKSVAITQFGDAIDKASLSVGQSATAHIDIESREYNGRWYTDVKAWKIETQGAYKPRPKKPVAQQASFIEDADDDDGDSLPF